MFTLELVLPSGKKHRIPELNNKDYLDIIKFCVNKDYRGLSEKFYTTFISKDLDIIDAFFTLLYARSVFVSDNLVFSGEDDININISLDTILNKLLDNDFVTERKISCGDIRITLGSPTGVYFDTIDDLYQSTIRDITINKTKIDFCLLDKDEQDLVLGKLPTEVFLEIQSHITKLSENLEELTLIENNEDFGIPELKVSILGNGIIQFVSSIFNYDLQSFFQTLYNYNHFVSKGSGDFFTLTFSEVMLMISMHAERIKKENEEAKRQQQR